MRYFIFQLCFAYLLCACTKKDSQGDSDRIAPTPGSLGDAVSTTDVPKKEDPGNPNGQPNASVPGQDPEPTKPGETSSNSGTLLLSKLTDSDLRELTTLSETQVMINDRCGGTLVGKGIVVSTASCLDLIPKSPESGLTVRFQDNTSETGLKVHTPPLFALSGTESFGLDIAVIELSKATQGRPVASLHSTPETFTVDDMAEMNIGVILFEKLSPKFKLIPFINDFGMPKNPITFEHVARNDASESAENLEFLAGFSSNNPCEDQMGSGLFTKKDGRWVLTGIASRSLARQANGGSRCDSGALSTVFTKSFAVQNYLNTLKISVLL